MYSRLILELNNSSAEGSGFSFRRKSVDHTVCLDFLRE